MEYIPVYGDVTVAVNERHRFGTDAMLQIGRAHV